MITNNYFLRIEEVDYSWEHNLKMAGAVGLNLRMPIPKTGALPLGYAPSRFYELIRNNMIFQF